MTISKEKTMIRIINVKIDESFWSEKIEMISKEVIPYQWNILNDNLPDTEPSHAVENFRIAAGESSNKYFGMIFQDSDVAKWIEGASYSLLSHPNSELEKIIDDLIDLIEKAQQPDGYLNTYFTLEKPDKRFQDMSFGHELYCAGHLIEAAVAYYQATGKKKFLNLMCRYADYIDSQFGPEDSKMKKYPGHEEIELALVKLYRVTFNKRYLKLSQFFIEERGKQPSFLVNEPTFGLEENDNKEWFDLAYHQAHLPVRQQEKATGHTVRAMYLYAAMADLVLETNDQSLFETLITLWDNVTQCRIYITGALGSQRIGERFTFDYDLPNDRAYAETCASIGLLFWSHRMLLIEQNSKYADIFEKALYNACLDSISWDGKKYFYSNPLEVFPEAIQRRYDLGHISPDRLSWYGCACCPPNIVRLITSLDQYIYTCDENTIYAHQYINSEIGVQIDNLLVTLVQRTEYPWEEDINLIINSECHRNFTLALRIPEWCRNYTCKLNGKEIDINSVDKGYLKLTRFWVKGDSIELHLEMSIELMQSHPLVRENRGKVAILRGPVVYCLEEVDNGRNLPDITLLDDSKLTAEYDPNFFGGMVVIKGTALRSDDSVWENTLYQSKNNKTKPIKIKAVPYFIWNNRSPGEMLVWIMNR